MSFSPDGRTLAVSTGEGHRSELHFVDVAKRRAWSVGAWPGFVNPARWPKMSLAFAPDGRHIAVALATWSSTSETPVTQRFLLLDARTGRAIWRHRYPGRHGQWEFHVLFAPSGALITSALQGDTIVWSARTGRIIRRYPVGGRPALSPDGRRLALGLNGRFPDPSAKVGVLDLRSGRLRKLAHDLHEEWIMSLAFTRDGTRIVGAAFEGTYVWDIASGQIVERFRDEQTDAASGGIAVDRRGLVLVTPGDGGVSAWDPDGALRVGRVFRWGSNTKGCRTNPCTVIDSRGTLMATSLGDGTVAVVDLDSKQRVARLPARDGAVAEGLAFLPGGRRLATGGIGGSVTIWDLSSHKAVRRLRYSEPVRATAVSPDGTLVAVQRQADGGRDSHVEVHDLRSGDTLYTHTIRSGDVLGLSFSADGRTLVASGCCRGASTVAGWDARSGAQRFRRTIAQQAEAFAISPDARTLAVGTQDGHVMLLDARNGKQRGPATKVAGSAVVQIAVSPDGHLLALAPRNGGAALWDLRSGSRVGDEFPLSPFVVAQVAFEPDGRLLLTEIGSAIEWPVDRPTLQRFACQIAGRDLTRDQWANVLPNRPYRPVC